MSTVIAYNDEVLGAVPVTQNEPLPATIVDPVQVSQAANSPFVLMANGSAVFAPNRYASQAAEASAIVKIGPGVIYRLAGYNAKVSAQFIQIFDAVTVTNGVPADGAIPIFAGTVAASSNFLFDFGVFGKKITRAIVVTNSSTVATKTIGSADCQFYVDYL